MRLVAEKTQPSNQNYGLLWLTFASLAGFCFRWKGHTEKKSRSPFFPSLHGLHGGSGLQLNLKDQLRKFASCNRFQRMSKGQAVFYQFVRMMWVTRLTKNEVIVGNRKRIGSLWKDVLNGRKLKMPGADGLLSQTFEKSLREANVNERKKKIILFHSISSRFS